MLRARIRKPGSSRGVRCIADTAAAVLVADALPDPQGFADLLTGDADATAAVMAYARLWGRRGHLYELALIDEAWLPAYRLATLAAEEAALELRQRRYSNSVAAELLKAVGTKVAKAATPRAGLD